MSRDATRLAEKVKSRYAIEPFDKVMLSYGAFCGFLLVLYALGNPVLAFVLGVPPGIFGFGIPMLIHKRFGLSHNTLAALPIRQQRQTGLTIFATLGAMLAYRAIAGDWFGFGCTAMLAGAVLLILSHELGYFTRSSSSDNSS